MKQHRIIGIIPARGGSKGVTRKNIRELNGRPLLAHTIEQARNVPELDLIVVSTDDIEIKSVALNMGVRVIDRPAELATDESSTESALLHVMDVLQAEGANSFDYVVVLEPTSPLRSPETIRKCIRKILEHEGTSLMTVRQLKDNLGMVKEGIFQPLLPGAPRRRQERQPVYAESGTVYICRVDHLRRTGSLVADDWMAFEVSEIEAVDINTPIDFELAEILVKNSEAQR